MSTARARVEFAALILVVEFETSFTALELHVLKVPHGLALDVVLIERQVVAVANCGEGGGLAVAVKYSGRLSATGVLVLDLVRRAGTRELEALQ
jgi:hypothetical protein